jgi:hypothetical protein
MILCIVIGVVLVVAGIVLNKVYDTYTWSSVWISILSRSLWLTWIGIAIVVVFGIAGLFTIGGQCQADFYNKQFGTHYTATDFVLHEKDIQLLHAGALNGKQ